MVQPNWGARGGLRFVWLKVHFMSAQAIYQNCNPRATGSLRHFIVNLFCATLKTAPISVNISIQVEIVLVLWQHFNFIIQTSTNSFRWRMLRCEVSTFLTVIPYFLFQSTRLGKRKILCIQYEVFHALAIPWGKLRDFKETWDKSEPKNEDWEF